MYEVNGNLMIVVLIIIIINRKGIKWNILYMNKLLLEVVFFPPQC